MKIIVSHDVDHLYGSDHLRDLTYPKLWVRETLAALGGRISFREWRLRMASPFRRERNHIEELTAYDSINGVKSSFFFGMENGLGMSYRREKALPYIKMLDERGFGTGVHGIAYNDGSDIRHEFDSFTQLTGRRPEGIRMHYVRFDGKTFERLAACGYRYDSTEFDKSSGKCIKAPYKVGTMWEFPLCAMDGYLPYPFEQAKQRTLELLQEAAEKGTGYFTVLFHDCFFCDAWGETKKWYCWLIDYLKNDPNCEFVSFADAIGELEMKNG